MGSELVTIAAVGPSSERSQLGVDPAYVDDDTNNGIQMPGPRGCTLTAAAGLLLER